MSNLALLFIGFVVTLIVAGSLTLLFWAEVQDGRDEEARLERERDLGDSQVLILQAAGANVVPLEAPRSETLRRGAA